MEDNLQTLKPGVSVIVTESLNFVVPTRRRFVSNLNRGGSGDPAETRDFQNPGGRSFQGSVHFRAFSLHGKKRCKYTKFSALGLEDMSIVQETKYYETSDQSRGFIFSQIQPTGTIQSRFNQ